MAAWEITVGECAETMRQMPAASVDAVVCDPPYGLRFMGKEFDTLGDGPAQQEWHRVWARSAFGVLKDGAPLMAFGGTRTFHRLTLALDEAGFAVDTVWAWCYGSGFPKSKNVALAIDKGEGHPNRGRAIPTASSYQACDTRRENKLTSNRVGPYEPRSSKATNWQGWGTALKPAWEPIVVAHKPGGDPHLTGPGFYYCAKANKRERNAGLDDLEIKRPDDRTVTGMGTFEEKGVQPQRNHHPTVKPVDAMRWLVRAATQPGDLVLDPFAGSGTTGVAAILEHRDFRGIEMNPEYAQIADLRCRYWESHAGGLQEALF